MCSCLLSIARALLMIINGLFLLMGAIMLGIGIWVIVDSTYLLTLISNFDTGGTNVGGLLSSSAYIIIAFGAFVFVLGFCGFCGAWKEVKFLLIVYAFLVLLVIIIEVVAIILAVVYYDTVVSEGTEIFTKAIQTNYEGQWNTSNSVSLAIDGVQIGLMCCGINNYTDFALASKWNKQYQPSEGAAVKMAAIPPTCCKYTDTSYFPAGQPYQGMEDATCPFNTAAQADSYKNTGCYDQLISYVESYSLTVIIVVAVIAAVEIFAVMVACLLRNDIIKRDTIA